MSSEPHELLHLPLPRGSLAYLAMRMHYRDHEGWSLHVLHRHDGERDLCTSRDHYDQLTLDELIDLVGEHATVAHYRFETTTDGRCRVRP